MKLKDVLAIISSKDEIIIEEPSTSDPNELEYAWLIRPMEDRAKKKLPLEAEVDYLYGDYHQNPGIRIVLKVK